MELRDVKSLYETAAAKCLDKMEKYEVQILAIQEKKWKDNGTT